VASPTPPPIRPALRWALSLATLLFVLAWVPGCAVSTPLHWRTEPGATGDTLYVSVTHAVLRRDKRSPFDAATGDLFRSFEAQEAYPGLLAYARRKQLFGSEVWTLTVWRDEASHSAFVRAPGHREAMRQGRSALRRTRFAQLEWPLDQGLPSWREALRALESAPYFDHFNGQD
jgi:heme-degrading monooxygenase HmoA